MGDSPTDSVDKFPVPRGEKSQDGKQQRFFTKETFSPGFWRQLYATIAVSFAAFSAGNALGWGAPIVLQLVSSPVETPVDSVQTLNTILTIMQLSSIVSMMICGFMMDNMGRRAGCWFLTLFAPAGWVFLALATTQSDLYAGAAMVGSTMAAGLVVALTYISELSNDESRGHFLSLIVFFHSGGVLFSHIVGDFVNYKTFNLICLFVSLLFPFVFHPLPESPTFLILKSRPAEAKTSIEWYYGNDPEIVENEMKKLQEIVIPRAPCKTLLSSRGNRSSLIIILFVSIFAELCGTTVVETYTSSIIRNIIKRPDGVGENTLVLSLYRFFAGLASVYLVEKTGRRLMQIIALAVMSISLAVLAVLLAVTEYCDEPINIWAVTATLSLYTLANQISLAVGEVVCCEIASADMRGMFMAIGGTARIFTLIACLQIHTCFESSYYGNSSFQAFSCAVGAVVATLIIPETKGKTLVSIREDIEKRHRKVARVRGCNKTESQEI